MKITGTNIFSAFFLGTLMVGSMSKAMSTWPEDGCKLLNETAADVCMAKVDCSAYTQYIPQARAVYGRCVARQPVSLDEVNALFELFGNERNFRCCIGNALNANNDLSTE